MNPIPISRLPEYIPTLTEGEIIPVLQKKAWYSYTVKNLAEAIVQCGGVEMEELENGRIRITPIKEKQ